MASSLFSLPDSVWRIYRAFNPPTLPKNANPLRIGILGAADIAPMALVNPARTHADVVVHGIAARDRVFDTYDALINDPEIEGVYNPLPNGLHALWTRKCIEAGKHDLLEKPSASNAQEASEPFALAAKKNVVVLEAFHYRFHPALHEFPYQLYEVMPTRSLGASGSLWKETDIRFNYPLAGGVFMDLGCYAVSSAIYACRAAGGTDKRAQWPKDIQVSSADAELFIPTHKNLISSKSHCDSNGKPAIDRILEAQFEVPSARLHAIKCSVRPGLSDRVPTWIPFLGGKRRKIIPSFSLKETFQDGTSVELYNYIFPTVYHHITTTLRGLRAEMAGVKEGTKRYSQAYVPTPKHTSAGGPGAGNAKGGEEQMRRAAKDGFWSAGKGKPYRLTYRWMLEAFVESVRKSQAGTPAKGTRGTVWVSNDESVAFMRTLDLAYEKAGLPRSGT
ncbi:hypothetical protein K437DRAFT_290422 [Tilletiaria anomala UBC 951]|uniref:D-xylose 1-dehydrogenase (NADP(+), D-xylono-1,5-lactone-forming) n=1 Tax=Tilletiaria anomala (strain ATCC 24038 / CBS 436.72 / UBC 951) TaxID=1037660 RepID=A0A066W407_TILAU|nr:uncharacterized protein K437DRAFT_290422 [Tilletiaria anomala UBC 951]KDN48446.1 hypothetical protein K437DRAFT_290422 [Tilletiaria anomala UBC 951]